MKNKLAVILIFVAGLIGINALVQYVPLRLDLTEDKRYSLSDATKHLLTNLDDEVYVKVYLTGDNLPAGFKRLEGAIRQTLDEFQVEAGKKIQYRFVDLNTEIKDEKLRNNTFIELANKGITPTTVFDKKDGHKVQTLIAPGATITYKGKEIAVLLLRGNRMASAQETLNQAYEGVEYQLATAIKSLTQTERKKIGFFLNYSSLAAIKQIDLIKSLKRFYDLYPVDIAQSPTLDGLDAIFVLKPDKPFSDSDIYKIDQFIVKGGKALFFVDALKVDSLAREGSLANPIQTNLDDLFFKFGVRMNQNLIKDAQMCAAIPMEVGNMGNNTNVQLVPWQYYPLLNSFGKSVIVRNLDAVYARYAGSLDTVAAKGISKTPLLMTSPYTQVLKAPALISYNAASKDFDPKIYNQGIKTVGMLLEGNFSSLFNNRILPSDPRAATFVDTGKPSKIIICTDGDIPTNDFDRRQNTPLPLGFDSYSGNTFANKDFVMNAVDYLLDENGVITARSKEVKLRPLDRVTVAEERSYWQVVNLALPVILLLLWGGLRQWLRKTRYS
jgi:ABC-2 type transport system permease protein